MILKYLYSTLFGGPAGLYTRGEGGYEALSLPQPPSSVAVVYRSGYALPFLYLLGHAPSPAWRFAVTLSLAWQNRLLWLVEETCDAGLLLEPIDGYAEVPEQPFPFRTIDRAPGTGKKAKFLVGPSFREVEDIEALYISERLGFDLAGELSVLAYEPRSVWRQGRWRDAEPDSDPEWAGLVETNLGWLSEAAAGALVERGVLAWV